MARAVVTGGAGFLGSHLCEALLARGWDVVAVDDFSTGRRENVAHLLDRPGFDLVEHDVVHGIPVDGPVDAVLHFASPASPPVYLARPIATLEVGSIGTQHALELVRKHEGARFLLASTSEIYGDPLVHPQAESYWGNVNSVGPRSVYDEAKRYAEAITMAYHRAHGIDTKIVRIFNTFGPRLAAGDGRVVSNFLAQAMRGEALTVYGTGRQTRSFCYVDDEVAGILALLESDHVGPMNIGNPDEFTVLQLAEAVREVTGTSAPLRFEPLPVDDPQQRRPDITLARAVLGWAPTIGLRDGLARTFDAYRRVVERH
jgi:dTDP-glucose 4,6-dehydratase